MKLIFRKTSSWFLLTLLTAAAAFAFGQDLPAGEGKTILENSCTSCHGLELVTEKHQTKEAWQETVNTMIAAGAELKEAEIPVLVDYLAKNLGPAAAVGDGSLPAGEGKTILENSCTSCHGLELVTDKHMAKDAWQEVVNTMIAAGAEVKEAEIPVLVEYLVKNFGPQ